MKYKFEYDQLETKNEIVRIFEKSRNKVKNNSKIIFKQVINKKLMLCNLICI